MSPAVEHLPSGQPTGNGRGPQPYRRPARRVRKIDFAQLDGLSKRARPGAARHRGHLDRVHGTAGEARPAVCEVAGGAEGEVPVRSDGRCDMTDQPMDYRDYLIQQHEQERMRQQFEGLFSKSDEDHAADQAELVSQQAYDTAEACAVGALEVEEALTEVVTGARDLRKRISSGLASEKDAREALGNLRKLRTKLVARTASIKTAYEAAVKTIEDPAARATALKNKYPALRR